MATASDQKAALPAVVRHVIETIGADPAGWSEWPGGWPDEIGTALVDTIYSARTVYKSKRGRGIHPLITAWRDDQSASAVSLRLLSREIHERSPASWAKRFGNSQTSPGRPTNAPGGPTKAAAIMQAAETLVGLDVDEC